MSRETRESMEDRIEKLLNEVSRMRKCFASVMSELYMMKKQINCGMSVERTSERLNRVISNIIDENIHFVKKG